MLFAVDFYEDLIDVESIAVTPVLSLQSACVNGAKFDAPETDCFSGDSDASFGEEIFNISVAQIEAVVEPESLPHEVLWVQRRK